MPGSWRSYTEAERAAAVGRALAVGTKKAATELGIPRRTLSSWLQRPTAEVQAAIASTRTDVAASFWAVVDAGTKAMLAKIGDPKTRAGELAAIVKTAVESHALLTGGATARTANLNVNLEADPTSRWADNLTWEQGEAVRKSIDEMSKLIEYDEDALQAWLADGTHPDGTQDDMPGIVQLRDLQRQGRELEAGNG